MIYIIGIYNKIVYGNVFTMVGHFAGQIKYLYKEFHISGEDNQGGERGNEQHRHEQVFSHLRKMLIKV